MSEDAKTELAELTKPESSYWEGDRAKLDRVAQLHEQLSEGASTESKHQREIREWAEEQENPAALLNKAEPPVMVKGEDGKYRPFSWATEVDPEKTIDKRPDLYEFNPDMVPITEEESLIAVESFDDMKEHYKNYHGIELKDSDYSHIKAMDEVATALKLDDDTRKAIWDSYVHSDHFGKVYTKKEGEEALLRECGGSKQIANKIVDGARQAIAELPRNVQERVFETEYVGNNPSLLIALSNMIFEPFGGLLDDMNQDVPLPTVPGPPDYMK